MKTFYHFILFLALLHFENYGHCQTRGTSVDLNIRFLEAAVSGDYPIVYDCLKKGVDINTKSWDGVTALMYATAEGHKSIVKLLIDSGAKVNEQPLNGLTALITASQYGYTNIVEMLLADSAQVDMTNLNKATALHYASLYNNDTIVFSLLQAGANPDASANDQVTPLHMASINGSYEAAYLLIDAGANLNTRDNLGFTPLMLACQNGSFEIAELLLSSGAYTNTQNTHSFSALSLAILNKHPDIVSLLLENGALMDEPNSLSLNPRSLAKLSGDSSIMNILKKAGARTNLFPAFKRVGVGAEINFSSSDLLTGIFLTQHDFKFDLDYNLGYALRPSPKKIRFTIPDVGEYQFMERRHLIYFDLSKGFNFNQNKTAGINIGGKLLYTFGKYRGTDIIINGGFNAAPVAWMFFRQENFEARLGYHYSNYNEKELSKSHFTINFVYNFYNLNTQNINRRLRWIN